MTAQRPASFFVPTLTFSVNMMEAARRTEVEGYLFTSSIGVYEPADVLHEDDVWRTFPSQNDRFAGWAKRMGELQAEAYRIEYGWQKVSIVRPANVYGPYDNFNSENAMVIPSLIRRAMSGENPLVVWGDGTPTREFLYVDNAAEGIVLAAERYDDPTPVNLGSGVEITIRDLVEMIRNAVGFEGSVEWDTTKPNGQPSRWLDVSRAKQSFGFEALVSLDEGIQRTVRSYRTEKSVSEAV